MLTELERRTGRRVADVFDLVAGTSTGGILAAALTMRDDAGAPRWTAEQLIDLYVPEGPEILSQSLTDKHDIRGRGPSRGPFTALLTPPNRAGLRNRSNVTNLTDDM